jgi:glyoxylase-like metal-dependent hydrolase (beta-lactamase superfamily II)
MRVYHLNCGTMRTIGFFPFSTLPALGTGKLFGKGIGIIHVLVVDTGEGLILVDTGYGTKDYTNPNIIVRLFGKSTGLEVNVQQSALYQIKALGYDPEDVKHIFLTHMHLDHSGGLPDFPQAKVHIYEKEYRMVTEKIGLEWFMCIPEHWAHKPDWVVHRLEGDTFHGLERTQIVNVNGVEVFLIPFVGHTVGHCAVVLHLPDGRWVIHAGDGYGYHGQVHPEKPTSPPYQWLFKPLFKIHRVTGSILKYDDDFRHLAKELGEALMIFPAHDPYDFERLSGEMIASSSQQSDISSQK